MQIKENNNVEVIWDTEKNQYGIVFITDDYKITEQLMKIKMTFIRYDGKWNISNVKNENSVLEAHFIKFENMPKNLLESVAETIQNKIQNENLTEVRALKFILDLFAKFKLKKGDKKQLIGDLGELIFMLKAKEFGIDADQKIRLNEFGLYDFAFANFFVEVKSSSKDLGEIVIDYRQISESEKRKFIVSKFQVLENESTICDLYEKLNSKNELLIQKQIEYESWKDNEISYGLIKENTINLNNVECFVLDESIIPVIKIINEGGLKKLKCHIGITNVKKIPLDILKEEK